MMRARLVLLVIAAFAPLCAQQPALPGLAFDEKDPAVQARLNAARRSDPLLGAMLQEMSRARNLRSLGESIYYLEVNVDDAEGFGVSAALGSIFAPTHMRVRPIRVLARVGSEKFDNTNSIFSDYYSGTRYDSDTLPLDNDPLALRQGFWLSIDRAYKTAVEALGRKAAALRGVNAADQLPDYWTQPPRILIEEPRRFKVDEELWTSRVRTLSTIFGDYPTITSSSVEFESSQGTFYHADSTGSVVRVPDEMAIFRVRASLQAPDGTNLYDGSALSSLDPAKMPAEKDLRSAVEAVAKNLSALAAAPTGESYTGPVLFDAQAAAQLFGEVFGAHLGVSRRPVSEPGRNIPAPISEMDGRIGSRVLPEWMSLTDDPTLHSYKNQPLLGYYPVDLEGIYPAPLKLVENGVLKTLITSRQPVKGVNAPNGRGRLPGVFGLKLPRISNLLVSASKTETDDQLKQRLIELIKTQSKPYGILVRKMDFPSSGSMQDLRRVGARAGRSGGSARPISSPILIYQVFPDGSEKLVRGLRFRSLGTRSFKDILAAGDREAVFNFVDNGAPLALMGAGNFIVGCSVVSPSLLFDELELESGEDDLFKTPVVPPPPVTASK